MRIDLHLHTSYSDGVISIEELVRTLLENDINIFAKTDHDTVKGNDQCTVLAKEYNLNFIPGTELSTYATSGVHGLDETYNIHIVGLGVDSDKIAEYCNSISFNKQQSLRNIVYAIKKKGYEINVEDLNESGRIVDRGAIAKLLVEKGYFASKKEAFDNLLNTTELIKLSVFANGIKTTISAIHQADGIAIWAHPFEVTRGRKISLSTAQIEQILPEMLSSGIDGLESYYQSFSEQQKNYLHALASKYNLLESYGSDYHGRSQDELELLKKSIDAEKLSSLLSKLNIKI